MYYLIKFVDTQVERYNGTYYSEDERWTGVPKERATRLTHKEARRVRGHLKQPRIAIPCVVEPE